MPESQQTLLEDTVATIVVILRVLVEIVVSSVKALLPCGVLPRKSVCGEVVLITGSGSGIGRLMAIEFGKLGARLVLWDVDEKNNIETKRLLEEKGVEAHAYTVDLSKRASIYEVANRVKAEVGNVNILVNNAGIVNGRKLLEATDEAMETTMAVNTNSLFFTTKAFLSEMLSANHGHVVVIASMAGKFGSPGLVDYCASKFGAVGFAESLAAELYVLKKTDVHVTTVCPFYINTGMFSGVQTKSRLFPMLEPGYAVEQIMEAILTNRATLLMPKTCYFFTFLASFLPARVGFILSDYYGTYEAMEHFVGRSSK